MTGSEQASAVLQEWVEQAEVECEPGARPGEWVLTLPGEAKLRIVVSVMVGKRALSVSAFVIRRPDENQESFYRWLLSKNLRLAGVAFALDPVGDVFLTGRLPLAAVNPDTVDQLFGAVLAAADSSFNELLLLGFFTSMRKEWQWRVSRGESLANLEKFRARLEGEPPGQEDQPQR